jgi:hypothetical protein
MSSGACQSVEATRRVLGAVRPGDPPGPLGCSGDTEWHNFRTLDSGDPVPFFLCEAHRRFLRDAHQARLTRPT